MNFRSIAIICVGLFLIGCGIQNDVVSLDSANGEIAPQADPSRSTIQSAGKPWAHSAFLHDDVARHTLLPLKSACAKRTLSWKFSNSFPYHLKTVVLEPGMVDLAKSGGFAQLFDVAFSPDCSQVFAIASEREEDSSSALVQARDIYQYDVDAGKWAAVSHNLMPAWHSLDAAKPAPEILYPLNDRELFVTAMNITTGRDAYTDFTSKGIFDLEGGTINWIEQQEGGLSPVIFDAERSILTLFIVSNEGSHTTTYTLTRRDIQLPHGSEQSVVLGKNADFDALIKVLYGDGFPCIRVNFSSTDDYAQCMDSFWTRAFPQEKSMK